MSGIDVVVKVVGSVDRMNEGRVDRSRKETCLRVSDGKKRAVRLGFDKGRLCICSFLHSFPPLSSFSFPPWLAQTQSFESLIHFARAWSYMKHTIRTSVKAHKLKVTSFSPFLLINTRTRRVSLRSPVNGSLMFRKEGTSVIWSLVVCMQVV
jgi:hypothetical protein